MHSESSELTVASFYRFVHLPDYREMQERVYGYGYRAGIRGTVLLAEEGINSTIAGPAEGLQQFFANLASDPRFADLEVKYSVCNVWPFHRWRVRLKKEIVRMKAEGADPLQGVGEYVEPAHWNAVIQDPNTLVVDVRNDYEVEYGSFEGAVNPYTADFWEFPDWVAQQQLEPNRPIAMFCTGGIRCERATAYLRSQGFTHVMHLKGGILNYLERVPEDESLWRGSCFVFDDREALDHRLKPIAEPKA